MKARAGLEGDPHAVAALSGAVGRTFVSPGVSTLDPAHFAAFRGGATRCACVDSSTTWIRAGTLRRRIAALLIPP